MVIGISENFRDIDFFRDCDRAVSYVEGADERDRFYTYEGVVLDLVPQPTRWFALSQPWFRLVVDNEYDLGRSRAELRLWLIQYLVRQHPECGMADEGVFALSIPELLTAVVAIRGYTA